MMRYYLKENDVHIKDKDGSDVNLIMRDMMSVILEGTLDTEMDEEIMPNVGENGSDLLL